MVTASDDAMGRLAETAVWSQWLNLTAWPSTLYPWLCIATQPPGRCWIFQAAA